MQDNEIALNAPVSVSVEMNYEEDKIPESITDKEESSEVNQENPNEEFQEESDQETTEEVSSSKKPRSKRWEKERRDREEKYLLSQALAEEKRRNLELRSYLERSIDNNTLSAADKAINQLEMAEVAHAKALESNDALAAAKASTALIQANLAVERIASQKMYSRDDQEEAIPQINPTAYAAGRLLNDWLSDNPEFDEDSQYFNRELVNKVTPLINKLDAKLAKRGEQHLISSPMYFDVIDTVISQIKSGKIYNRPVTGSVSSRNNNYQSNNTQRIQLTDQQKRAAAGCNMSEEQYINWLKKYEREKKENNRYEYGY